MEKIKAPISNLKKYIHLNEYVSNQLNLKILNELGFFIIRDGLNKNVVNEYLRRYLSELSSGRIKKSDYHLTEVKVTGESSLVDILKEKDFQKLAINFFNGNVGSDFIRVINKDSENYASVFLHQDTSYQIGNFERYSFFIALTDCNESNGGIILYPGTHKFGYLGDAGEIKDFLPDNFPKVESSLFPGDILIMHSSTWHKSNENLSRTNRTYLEVHLQNINEPSTIYNIAGVRKSEWLLNMTHDEIFANSRTQRIRSLQSELEKIKKNPAES